MPKFQDPSAETLNKIELLEVHLDNSRRILVPMSLTACLLVLYILLGATFFYYRQGWPFSTCCYFCVVTLATIGFGDYIPGSYLLQQLIIFVWNEIQLKNPITYLVIYHSANF